MIKTFLDKNNIDAHFDESMKKHTTFKVGGNAMCIAMPDSIEKTAKLIEFLKNNNITNNESRITNKTTIIILYLMLHYSGKITS